MKDKEVKMTVKEVEENPEVKSESTYMYLSVIPEAEKPELIKLFEKTFWNCANIIIIKESVNLVLPVYRGRMSVGGLMQLTNRDVINERFESGHIGSVGVMGLSGPMGSPGPSGSPGSPSNIEFTIYGNTECKNISQLNLNSEDNGNDQVYQNDELNELMLPYKHNLKAIEKMERERKQDKQKYLPPPRISDKAEELAVVNDIIRLHNTQLRDLSRVNLLSLSYKDCSPESLTRENLEEDESQSIGGLDDSDEDDMADPIIGENIQHIIQDSYAGKITHGKKVHVSSTASNIEYNYETPATPCIIGLSISHIIEFKDIDVNEYIEISKELITDAIENANKSLLESLNQVFVADRCCICLDDEDKNLNTIFYNCGHQCCHKQCAQSINKCPVCRTLITAQIATS